MEEGIDIVEYFFGCSFSDTLIYLAPYRRIQIRGLRRAFEILTFRIEIERKHISAFLCAI